VRIAFRLLACCVVLGACTRWSPLPVPVARAFATDSAREVAIRFVDDSAHWWRIREARLVGDSIIGLSRRSGHLERVAISADTVLDLVVRQPDQVGNGALLQMAELAALLGMIEFIALTFPIFGPKGWSL